MVVYGNDCQGAPGLCIVLVLLLIVGCHNLVSPSLFRTTVISPDTILQSVSSFLIKKVDCNCLTAFKCTFHLYNIFAGNEILQILLLFVSQPI